MSNSNGDNFEKTTAVQQESKNVLVQQAKRKRNRNRKKKVENLVSKTFQAKFGNPSQSENKTEAKVSLKSELRIAVEQAVLKNSCVIKVQEESESQENSSSQKPIQSEPEKDMSCTPKNNIEPMVAKDTMTLPPVVKTNSEKSRDEILAEREAKKLAKQQAKKKKENPTPGSETMPTEVPNAKENSSKESLSKILKNKVEENKTKELDETQVIVIASNNTNSVEQKLANVTISDSQKDIVPGSKEKKAVLSKAERRAIQEAQRAAKSNATKQPLPKMTNSTINENKSTKTETLRVEKVPPKVTKNCKVKLFNHLESCRKNSNLFANNSMIHPIIVRLGEQYAKRTIVGSNARCISFLSSLKKVIQDYETPPKKEFARSLETSIKDCVDHLQKCRPLAVSVCNAYKHIKHVLTQLPVEQPESELKEHLCHFIDTYIENQIGKAAEAISSSVQDKISNGDVILTFGCSSLINYIFEEAHRRHVDFRVIVVDSRPFAEGQELLRRLTAREIPCTYVLINAVGFVMPEVTKILLGAHALLSNGYVMARTGTAQVALVARSFNVPVLVCCETHKFSERFQTDAIVYNELGNPDDLIMSNKCRLMNWESQNKLSPLNLNYDITPPELVTAVVTEVAILPCTSVPVILRIKPTEIGY